MTSSQPEFAGCMPDGGCMIERMNDLDFAHYVSAFNSLCEEDGEKIKPDVLRSSCRADHFCLSAAATHIMNRATPELLENIRVVRGEAAAQRTIKAMEEARATSMSTTEAVIIEFPTVRSARG